MVLNQDCFREIILYIETHNIPETIHGKRRLHEISYHEICNAEELSHFTNDDKHYIITKLFEASYVNGTYIPSNNLENFHVAYISSLTLKGHDMAENIGNDNIWNTAKERFKGATKISLTLLSNVVGETASSYAKKIMGLE